MAGEINTIQDAVEEVFMKKGSLGGSCAGWVSRMARTFDAGHFVDASGGHCGTQQYINTLQSVNWINTLYLHGISQSEVIRRTEKEHDYPIGAIIMYRCLQPTGYKSKKDGSDHPYIYGHTQLYLGGTSQQDKCGWTTSVRNNYGSGFVYHSWGKNLPWDFWVFERDGVPSRSDMGCNTENPNVSFGDSNFKKPTNDAEKLDCGVKLAKYLMSAVGINDLQAAALCGNFWYESQFNPVAKYKPDKNGKSNTIGIVQWTYRYGRATKLENFAKERGLDFKTFDCQKQFIVHELNDAFSSSVLSPLRSATDIEVATRDIVGWKYETYTKTYNEILTDPSTPKRIDYAKRIYNAMHKGG